MYKQIIFWVQQYGHPDVTDQRGVEDYCVCESDEGIRILRNELTGVASGNYDEDALLFHLKEKRLARYGSFDEWAKQMLLWMAEARKQ